MPPFSGMMMYRPLMHWYLPRNMHSVTTQNTNIDTAVNFFVFPSWFCCLLLRRISLTLAENKITENWVSSHTQIPTARQHVFSTGMHRILAAVLLPRSLLFSWVTDSTFNVLCSVRWRVLVFIIANCCCKVNKWLLYQAVLTIRDDRWNAWWQDGSLLLVISYMWTTNLDTVINTYRVGLWSADVSGSH
jgi:hypothetical protein